MFPQSPPRGDYKLKEAAALYGVSVTSLRRKIATGRLQVCREFRHIIVTTQSLDDLFNPSPAAKSRRGTPS